MKKNPMFVSLAASLALTLTLTACGNTADVSDVESTPTATPTGEVPTSTPTTNTSSYVGIPEDIVLEVTGIASDAVVMKVNGVDILAKEVFYWLVSNGDQYARMGMTDWSMEVEGQTVGDMVTQWTKDATTYSQVIANLAKEEDCDLTQEELEEYNVMMDEMKVGIGAQVNGDPDVAFAYELAYYTGVDEETFFKMSHISYARELKLQDKLFGENGTIGISQEEIDAWIEEVGGVNAKHILIMATPSEDGTDDGFEAALETAQSICLQLEEEGNTEEAFDALMVQETHDVDMMGMPNNPDGYTYDKTGTVLGSSNQLVESFVTGGQALEIGQISEPVESQYGYHILMRTSVDTSSDVIRDTYAVDALYKYFDEHVQGAQVEYLEGFDQVCDMAVYDTFATVTRFEISEGMKETFPVEEELPEETEIPDDGQGDTTPSDADETTNQSEQADDATESDTEEEQAVG